MTINGVRVIDLEGLNRDTQIDGVRVIDLWSQGNIAEHSCAAHCGTLTRVT